jgi:hypothetical protein
MDELTKECLSATTKSSERTRRIFFVLISIAILEFGALWNSWKMSWPNSRLERATEALRYDGWSYTEATPDHELNTFQLFCKLRGLKNADQVRTYVDQLRQIQLERIVMIHVPFLGMSFDVNDLGVLGGLTFVILLLLFYYSLNRERINLRTAFDALI